MNKKFLKSVAIVGLASTALGMAQPVGAVVKGHKIPELKFSKVYNLGKIPDGWVDSKYKELSEILNEANTWLGSEEYFEPEFKKAREKLFSEMSVYENYLITLKLKASADVPHKKGKLTSLEMQKLSGISLIDMGAYNELVSRIKLTKNEFVTEVYNIYNNNVELYPYINKYLTNKDYLYLQDENYNIYKQLIDELTRRIRQVQKIVKNNNSSHKDETEILETLVNCATYESKGNNWSYYIPNIRSASQKLKEVDDAIEDFFKSIDREVPELLRRNDFYEKYLKKISVNREKSHQLIANDSDISTDAAREKIVLRAIGVEHQTDVGSLIYDDETVSSEPSQRLRELLDKYSAFDTEEKNEEFIQKSQDALSKYDTLKPTEKKKNEELYKLDDLSRKLEELIEESKQKSLNEKSKSMIIDFGVEPSHTGTSTIVTEIYQQPLRQTERVETIIINFPTQLTDSKPLPSLSGYGSTTVLGTIGGSNISNLSGLSGENSLPYTQLIGGSNTTPLVGSEGGYLNIELRTHASEVPVNPESTQDAQLSDESGKSDNITFTYKVSEPQEASPVAEELKVAEAPVVQKSQEILATPQISEETKNKDSLDEYTKSQINFWIKDFNTSLNKINNSEIYSEELENLITKGKVLRNKLDNLLGEDNFSDETKGDLDRFEIISNAISRMMENSTVTVAQ